MLTATHSLPKLRTRIRAGMIIGAAFGCGLAIANPDGPTVVAGSATISALNNELQISNSPGAIINWNGFSISPAEITRFLQQSDQSAVLNRVTGGALSNIQGQLQSNGRVFVVNPNGIVIGNGARINTAGFVASTLDISNADFAAGNYRFRGDSGRIVNNGAITSGPDGEVVLIAPSVENNGDIRVQGGEIILAAGREVVLTSLSDANISFRISAPGDSAVNLGSLIAQSGSIGVFADSVRNTGEISANQVGRDDSGRVVLFGDSATMVSGNVSSQGSGASGGEIQVLGDNIRLTRANLDASGTSGGGRVLIGGEFQGDDSLPRASTTTIDASSVVHADAISQGDGGEVIVWSESSTKTYGLLTARGGSIGGDGGLVETSSRGSLDFGQPADVSAIAGSPGTWLLDPEDIVIDSGRADSISTALNGGSNVQVRTADTGSGEGNITVAAPITKTAGDDASLGLIAHNRIDVNASITSTAGKLNVSLQAGRDINVNAGITTNGGNYSSAINPALADLPEPQESGEDTGENAQQAAKEVDDPDGEQLPPTANAADSADTDSEPMEDTVAENAEVADTSVTELVDALETAPDLSQEANGISLLASIDTGGGNLDADAGANGLLHIETSLNAANAETDGIGGNVNLLGNRVGLFGDAAIDASGSAGGGEVLIGGDQQGLNPDVRNADAVYLSDTSTVRADALQSGDGGRIIIYADDTANIYGELSVRGGEVSGNGGFVETSGKRNLRIAKTPDVASPNGNGGTWLIDPDQIDIVDSDLSMGESISLSGNTTTFESADSTVDNRAVISVGLIQNALFDGGNVRILTATDNTSAGTGDINWMADLDLNDSRVELSQNGEALGNLTLEAANDIVFTGSLYDSDFDERTGGVDDRINILTLLADQNGNGVGDIIFDAGQGVTSAPLIVESRTSIVADGTNLSVLGGSSSGQTASLRSGLIDINVSDDITLRTGSVGGTAAAMRATGGGSTLVADNLTIESGDFSYSSITFFDDINTYVNQSGSIDIANLTTLNVNSRISGAGTLTTGQIAMTDASVTMDTLTLESGTSTLTGDFRNAIDAIWDIEDGATVVWEDADIDIRGNTVNNRGVFQALGDDRLISTDGEGIGDGTFNNFGTFIKIGTDGDSADDSTEIGNRFGSIATIYSEAGTLDFNNTGTVTAETGDILFYQNGLSGTLEGGYTQTGTGAITQVGDGSSITSRQQLRRFSDPILPGTFFFNGGSITGANDGIDSPEAVINGNVELDAVTVAPGNSPGTLTVNGNLDATSNATFNMELDNPGDVVNVQGAADINGAQIDVSFFDGFEPADDELFTLINAVGGFSADSAPNVTLLDTPPVGLAFADFFLPDPPPNANEFVVGFFSATEPDPDPETPTGGGTPGTTPPIVEFGDPVPPPTVTFDPVTPRPVLDPTPLGDPTTPDPVDSSDDVVTLLDQDPEDEEVEDSPEFLQCI